MEAYIHVLAQSIRPQLLDFMIPCGKKSWIHTDYSDTIIKKCHNKDIIHVVHVLDIELPLQLQWLSKKFIQNFLCWIWKIIKENDRGAFHHCSSQPSQYKITWNNCIKQLLIQFYDNRITWLVIKQAIIHWWYIAGIHL